MKQVAMRFGDWIMAAFLVLGLAWLTGTYAVTATYWYENRSVGIANTIEGEPIILTVDRTVKRAFSGSYTVLLRHVSNGVIQCEAGGALRYKPGTELPDPVTLAWWAWSDTRCAGPNVPPGTYTVETCWTIHNPWAILPDKTICGVSNVFEVRPRVTPEQRQIDELKREIEVIRQP